MQNAKILDQNNVACTSPPNHYYSSSVLVSHIGAPQIHCGLRDRGSNTPQCHCVLFYWQRRSLQLPLRTHLEKVSPSTLCQTASYQCCLNSPPTSPSLVSPKQSHEPCTAIDTPEAARSHSHHSLTPPSLILPLQQNNVSELSISFVAGRWDQYRTGRAGPLHHATGGEGGEIRGWLAESEGTPSTTERWEAVTHALGGLFCATLGPSHEGDIVRSFGDVYPPSRESYKSESPFTKADPIDLTHFYLPHPNQHLCTENLTPFTSLLPSKGLSGLSHLLAQPGILLGWGFKTEGIHIVTPNDVNPNGQWTGWWEGVVDLVSTHGTGSRSSGIQTLFKRAVPRAFPEAESSVLRLIRPADDRFRVDPREDVVLDEWIDGKEQQVLQWDLTRSNLMGKDIRFWWEGEGSFSHREFTAMCHG